MEKNKHINGITRIDHRNTHGWYVRKSHNGKQHSKLFSDKKHGGKEVALEKALAFREKLVVKFQSEPKKPIIHSHRHFEKKITGKDPDRVGIYMITKVRRNGNLHPHYCASWYPERGKQKTQLFSVEKYTDEGALELAQNYRSIMLNKAKGLPYQRDLNRFEKRKSDLARMAKAELVTS